MEQIKFQKETAVLLAVTRENVPCILIKYPYGPSTNGTLINYHI